MLSTVLLTLFTLLISRMSGQGGNQVNCRFVADIVFILDESGSVGSMNFQTVRNFVSAIITALDVDAAKQEVRVGLVTFDQGSSIRINLGAYTDKADLLNQVQNNTPFNGGSTNLSAGLNSGLAVMAQGLTGAPAPGIGNTRPGISDSQVPRIFFVFGDGLTSNPTGTQNLATTIKDGMSSVPYPINIFSVFIGSDANGMAVFENIASKPLSMWFLGLGGFGQLNTGALVQQFCDTGSMTFGDVHFTTHDGVMYTFNGAGDYIYMKTEDKVDIHVRDVYVGRATALAAMALLDRKSGSVLEVWWDGEGAEKLNVNIRHVNTGNKVVELSRTKQLHQPFHIQQIGEGLVQIKHGDYHGFSVLAHYGGRASFQPRIPKDWKTSGLGGNNNGKSDDDLCTRSGNKCVSLNATNADVHKIGLDWAVLPSELLFEKWMPVQDWEIRYHALKINPEQLFAAKKLCGEVQPCIYDYISTGSEEYAKHTKNDYYSHILNEGKLVYIGDKY